MTTHTLMIFLFNMAILISSCQYKVEKIENYKLKESDLGLYTEVSDDIILGYSYPNLFVLTDTAIIEYSTDGYSLYDISVHSFKRVEKIKGGGLYFYNSDVSYRYWNLNNGGKEFSWFIKHYGDHEDAEEGYGPYSDFNYLAIELDSLENYEELIEQLFIDE